MKRTDTLFLLFPFGNVAVFHFTNFVIEANSRYAGPPCGWLLRVQCSLVHQQDCSSVLQILNASNPVYTAFYASVLAFKLSNLTEIGYCQD